MHHRLVRRAALRFLPLPLALLAPVAARAQYGTAQLPPANLNDPVERLSRYLRELSINPRSLDALTGAGHAALDVGDPSAAVGFFARAQEAAPRDGRVKAGLAAALVQLEQPRDALRLFDQARDLGVPEAEFATDRGLAYDLRGDGRRAQEDYRRALAARPGDPEATRRLALSLAMSGDRPGALAVLDPLLRKQDRAAWRASTFVLAMTGDTSGADTRVGQLMVPAQAQAMRPFLDRLAKLTPAEQAAAVHFGHFPTSARGSRGTQLADAGQTRRPAADRALVPGGAPFGIVTTPSRPATAAPIQSAPVAAAAPSANSPGFADAFAGGRDPQSRATRRRPGQADAIAASPVQTSGGARVAVASPAPGFSGFGTSGAPERLARISPPPSAPTGSGPQTRLVAPSSGVAQASGAVPAQTAIIARLPARQVTPSAIGGPSPMPRDDRATSAAAVTSAVPVVPVAAPRPVRPVVPAIAPVAANANVLSSPPSAALGRPSAAPVAQVPASLARSAPEAPVARLPAPTPAAASITTGNAAAQSTVPAGVSGAPAVPAATSLAEQAGLSAPPAEKPVLLADGGAAAAIRSFAIPPTGPAAAPAAATEPAAATAPTQVTPVVSRQSTEASFANPLPASAIKPRPAASPKPPVIEATAAKEPDDTAVKPRRGAKTATAEDVTTDIAPKAKRGAKGKAAAADTEEDAKPKLSPKEAKAKALADAKAAREAKEAKAKALADAKAAKEAKAKEAEAKRQARLAPERYWVQVAGGANKSDLPKAWAQAKEKHPELAGRTPHTTPLRFTNRLLVGPFKSADEAQAFVNKTGKSGWQTFTFTSPAGQKVEPIAAK